MLFIEQAFTKTYTQRLNIKQNNIPVFQFFLVTNILCQNSDLNKANQCWIKTHLMWWPNWTLEVISAVTLASMFNKDLHQIINNTSRLLSDTVAIKMINVQLYVSEIIRASWETH